MKRALVIASIVLGFLVGFTTAMFAFLITIAPARDESVSKII